MKLAYSNPDASVVILDVAPKAAVMQALGLTQMGDDEFLAFVRERSVPQDAVDLLVLPDDWTAPDRGQRDAWRIVNGEVVVP